MNKKIDLIIVILLDGWGMAEKNKGNAPALAKTPNLDKLMKKYAYTTLFAHGRYVGLPDNQPGNSEAGHMNIGAGRIINQDVVAINEGIKNETFFKNTAFTQVLKHVKKNKSKLHLMGMLAEKSSPHSDTKHIFSLLKMARTHKIKEVYLHLFTDGRDSPQYASLDLAKELKDKLHFNEKIVTVIGRFYAMDRRKKWHRTEMAYRALVSGSGRSAQTITEAITDSYNKKETDEFIKPYVLGNKKQVKDSRISNNDGVIFFNLRSDRARQLVKSFVQKDFNKRNSNAFKRSRCVKNLKFATMTDFGPDLDDILTAYPSIDLKGTLPIALSGISQLYMAESEKFAHVTYFLNGGYKDKIGNENYYLIASPDVKTYDETPEMKTKELTEKILENIKIKKYDFVFVNFAAPDMLGHTGNLKAAIECCEKIDKHIAKIVKSYLKQAGTVIITADHGNLDEMIDLKTGEVMSKHSMNKVPFLIINNEIKNKKLKSNGKLANIAPTILKLLNKDKPEEMTEKSLI